MELVPVELDAGELAPNEEWILLVYGDGKRYALWLPGRESQLPLKVREGFRIRASAGGLLYVENQDLKQAFVGNPVTNSWKLIPECPFFDIVYEEDFLRQLVVEDDRFFLLVPSPTDEKFALYDSEPGTWNENMYPDDKELKDVTSNLRGQFLIPLRTVYNPVEDRFYKVPEEDFECDLDYSQGMNGEALCTLVRQSDHGFVVTIVRWEDDAREWINVSTQSFDYEGEDFKAFADHGKRYIVLTLLKTFIAYDQLLGKWYRKDLDDYAHVNVLAPNKRKLVEQDSAPRKKQMSRL